jgi:arginine exporter protein ArgO
MAIAGAFSGGGVMLDNGITTYSQQVTERLAPVAGIWDTALTVISAMGLFWEKAAQPFVLYALIFAGALYLTCVGLGTACVRYALKRS